MKNDSGLLSIDFIAGFTIFMIAFIIVVTMVSGLLVSLQSRTIDYDALAYRTGVILTEDAGDPGGAGDLNDPYAAGWEVKNFGSTQEKNQIIRLGLALSKNYPNILSSAKVDKFFKSNTGLKADDYLAYRQKLMLFNYNNQYLTTTPTFYRFNIRLESIETPSDYPKESVPRNTLFPQYSPPYVGDDDTFVQNYGFSHRVVKIKQPSSMTVNLSEPPGDPDQTTFSVQYDKEDFNSTPLGITMGLRYNIDPYNEQTAVNVTLNNSASAVLISVRSIQYFNNTGGAPFEQDISPTSPTVKVYLNSDGKADPATQWPLSTTVNSHSNVLIVVEPGYLEGSQFSVKNASSISLKCTFLENVTARVEPIHYRYIDLIPVLDINGDPVVDPSTGEPIMTTIPNPNLTMPFMIPAVVEVKVW
jgi:hypothetical protein